MSAAEVEAKLRAWLTVQHGPVCPTFTVNGLMIQAADALSAQAVELERMREALGAIVVEDDRYSLGPATASVGDHEVGYADGIAYCADLARQALVKAG